MACELVRERRHDELEGLMAARAEADAEAAQAAAQRQAKEDAARAEEEAQVLEERQANKQLIAAYRWGLAPEGVGWGRKWP